MNIDFVKGHMGGNAIILVFGDQIPPGEEVDTALELSAPLRVGGHQVGILYPSASPRRLRARIVGYTTRGFITACGGLTQVLGRALVETSIGKHFGFSFDQPTTPVLLDTNGGLVEIKIETDRGVFKKALTDMESFVEECYEMGTYPMRLGGISSMKVGKFLVVNADALRVAHPSINLEEMDDQARHVLLALQQLFQRETAPTNVDFAIYDSHPEHGGDARVIFPHGIAHGHIEPACGTGSIAVVIAMLETGELGKAGVGRTGECLVTLESGGGIGLGGPDVTSIKFRLKKGSIAEAYLSHSLIEIISEGKAWL